MAPFLPIRAFNRSQAVRIGKQKVTATANTYIDLGDAPTRKEYAYHSSIGAVYPVGGLTINPSIYAVSGATVTATRAVYATGTAGTSGATVTGSGNTAVTTVTVTGVGTTFTSGMVGGFLVVGSSVFQVTGYTSATVLTATLVSGAATVATAAYSLIYNTTASLTPDIVAGEVSNRGSGLRIPIPAKTFSAITAPGSGLSRRDLISVNILTGVSQVTTGTTYTTGATPNVVATPAGDVAVAYVIATNGLTTLQVQDIRPLH